MIQKEVFSERLKAAMKKQNLKQIDLVRAAQVQGIKLGKSHVSQYVSGKTVPRTDILLFLAKTLQVEEEWLIEYLMWNLIQKSLPLIEIY